MKIKSPYWMLFAIPLIAVTVFATYSGKTQKIQDKNVWEQDLDKAMSQFPIADFAAAPPDSPELLRQRRAKGQKYDGQGYVDSYSEVNSFTDHWANNIPGLPVGMSDLVVAARVTDSQAFLANDKGAVYSEFKAEIEEVLQTEKGMAFVPKDEITVTRTGGRVRFSSGKVCLFSYPGQGMPQTNIRYVFFLKHLADKDFEIITAYALKDGQVAPLDHPGTGHPFTKFDGLDEASFLIQVRAAVAGSIAK